MTPSWFLSLDATHKIQVRSTFTFSIFFFSYGHTRYIHTGFFQGTTDAVKREKREKVWSFFVFCLHKLSQILQKQRLQK